MPRSRRVAYLGAGRHRRRAGAEFLDRAGATCVFGNWEASGLRGLPPLLPRLGGALAARLPGGWPLGCARQPGLAGGAGHCRRRGLSTGAAVALDGPVPIAPAFRTGTLGCAGRTGSCGCAGLLPRPYARPGGVASGPAARVPRHQMAGGCAAERGGHGLTVEAGEPWLVGVGSVGRRTTATARATRCMTKPRGR